MKFICITLILFSLLACGCRESKSSSKEASPTPVEASARDNSAMTASKKDTTAISNEPISVHSDIPNLEVGSAVTIDGEFWGWSASKAGCGNSVASPPVTRSDWLIKIEGGYCIYVKGSVPTGLNSATPNGEKVKISGTVKQTQSGQIYIEANN